MAVKPHILLHVLVYCFQQDGIAVAQDLQLNGKYPADVKDHVHVEVWKNGSQVDPKPLIFGKKYSSASVGAYDAYVGAGFFAARSLLGSDSPC